MVVHGDSLHPRVVRVARVVHVALPQLKRSKWNRIHQYIADTSLTKGQARKHVQIKTIMPGAQVLYNGQAPK